MMDFEDAMDMYQAGMGGWVRMASEWMDFWRKMPFFPMMGMPPYQQQMMRMSEPLLENSVFFTEEVLMGRGSK